jgi:hypothetical protein
MFRSRKVLLRGAYATYTASACCGGVWVDMRRGCFGAAASWTCVFRVCGLKRHTAVSDGGTG